MNGSLERSWSNNTNAPQIPCSLHLAEVSYLVGSFLGAMFYGIVVVLSFQCIGTLFNPANRRNGGIRWPLVAHTVAMFVFVTIYTAMYLHLQIISFVNNREYPGSDAFPPGPVGYQQLIYRKPISYVAHIMFVFNTWLVDGLILYRCYAIYSRNYWAIAFPCLLYLGSVAMGIPFIYFQALEPTSKRWSAVARNFGLPFFAISPALNVSLTLMIITRLALHRRKIKLVTPTETVGLYKAIIIMLIESCALYSVSFVLFIGPWGAAAPFATIFFPMVAQTQVIAPLLVIQRVAKQRAVKSDTGQVNSLRFKTEGGSTGGGGSFPNGYTRSPTGTHAKPPNELGVWGDTAVDLHNNT